eukprot:scaffold61725_cov24-Tisochrysis_lutea.AAC.2
MHFTLYGMHYPLAGPLDAVSSSLASIHVVFDWRLIVHDMPPSLQAPLKRHRLTPNLNLRNMVDDWIASCEAEYHQASNSNTVASADAHATQRCASFFAHVSGISVLDSLM